MAQGPLSAEIYGRHHREIFLAEGAVPKKFSLTDWLVGVGIFVGTTWATAAILGLVWPGGMTDVSALRGLITLAVPVTVMWFVVRKRRR